MKYKPFLLSTALLFMAAVGLWAEPVIQASAISGHEGTYSLGDEVVFNVTFTNTTQVVVAQEGVTTAAEANAQNQANTAKEFTVTGFLVGFDIYGNAVEVPVSTSGGNEVAPASTLEIQGRVMIPMDGTFHRLTDGGDSIVLYYTYTHTPVGGAAIIVGSGGAAISRIIELQGDLDFGNVPVGDSVLRSLVIRNVGTSELSVSGLALPAGFSGTWAGVIAPGEQQQVEVRFSPTLEQLYSGRVTVLSNQTSGVNTLSLSGTGVTSQVALQNGAIVGPFSGLQGHIRFFFIDVPSGQGSLDIQLHGESGEADFYVRHGSRPSLSSFNYRTNAAGSADTLSIASPLEGRWFILLHAESPFTGVRLSAKYEDAVVDTRIIRLTGDLDFGEVRVHDSESRELLIHNDGNVPLSVAEIQYSSGYSGEWSGVVQSGESRPLTILFHPTVASVNTGSVSVLSNATSGISTATLRGTGIADDTGLGFANSTSITLSDSGAGVPHPSTIDVSGLGSSIKNLKVTLRGLSHTDPSDLDVLLVGPSGESVILMSDAGGGHDLVGVTLGFDDHSSSGLNETGQIVSGIYRPTNYFAGDTFPVPSTVTAYNLTLDTFDGGNPNGTWSLYVVDDAAGGSGAIAGGWSLFIETEVEVALSPVWEPQGWVYYAWPYAYSFAEGRWHFFNAADTQWRVNLSNGQWGALDDATGWNYYAWPYSYSNDQRDWHWYHADTQWVVDLLSGVWARLGGSGD